MTCHYPDHGSTSDWSYRVGNLPRSGYFHVISVEFLQSSLGRQGTSCGVECLCSLRSSGKRPTCLGILGGHVWSAGLFVLLLAIKLIAGARIDTVG